MSVVGPQVTTDDRSFAQKLRRGVLEKACSHFDIPVKAGAPAMQTRALLHTHGISDAQLMEFVEHKVEQTQDENGKSITNVVPVYPKHESQRLAESGQGVDYEKIIAERAKENEAQEEVIESQADFIKNMMDRLKSIEENQLPLERMTPPQLKHIAKKRGLDIKGVNTKKDLLALLEG